MPKRYAKDPRDFCREKNVKKSTKLRIASFYGIDNGYGLQFVEPRVVEGYDLNSTWWVSRDHSITTCVRFPTKFQALAYAALKGWNVLS